MNGSKRTAAKARCVDSVVEEYMTVYERILGVTS